MNNCGDREQQYRRLGAVIEALASVKEDEIVMYLSEVLEAAFADSIGWVVMDVLLESWEPLSLSAIAERCGCGRRSILPNGEIRSVVNGLVDTGILVNLGTQQRPGYQLNEADGRVRMVAKIVRPEYYYGTGDK